MRVMKPGFDVNRQSAEQFVDETLALAHEKGDEFERKMFGLVYRINRNVVDEFLELLETFKEDLGCLLHYVRAFTIEQRQYRESLH